MIPCAEKQTDPNQWQFDASLPNTVAYGGSTAMPTSGFDFLLVFYSNRSPKMH